MMAQDPFSGPEKRQFKRLNKAFVVNIHDGTSSDWNVVLIHNISRGGLRFGTDSDLKIGAILKLKINIALNSEPIPCSGKVVYVKPSAMDETYLEIGVSFTEIKDTDADLISAKVEELSKV